MLSGLKIFWVGIRWGRFVKDKRNVDSGGYIWWKSRCSLPPDIHANEEVLPLMEGGSNLVWMLTEWHRREIVLQRVCLREKETDLTKACGAIL